MCFRYVSYSLLRPVRLMGPQELIGDMKSEYVAFCQRVFYALSRTVAVRDHPTLQDLMSWLNTVAILATSS